MAKTGLREQHTTGEAMIVRKGAVTHTIAPTNKITQAELAEITEGQQRLVALTAARKRAEWEEEEYTKELEGKKQFVLAKMKRGVAIEKGPLSALVKTITGRVKAAYKEWIALSYGAEAVERAQLSFERSPDRETIEVARQGG